MKKGFTLIELIGVIVLLAAVLLIIIPVVNNSLKEGKQEMLDNQIKNIELSLATYSKKPNLNETYYLTLGQLKEAGLVEYDLKNPITKEYFANDMILKMINTDGVVSYEILTDTGTCKYDYKDVSKITINGDNITYVEVTNENGVYEDLGATYKDGDNTVNITGTGDVDIKTIGSYYITYNTNTSKCNSSIRTVIVRDTTSPVITFATPELTIGISEADAYDFKADVTVTDNSGVTPDISVETNFSAIKGSYSIKYIVTDASGNVTTKLRKVTLK